jgi:PAS domain-containing protein
VAKASLTNRKCLSLQQAGHSAMQPGRAFAPPTRVERVKQRARSVVSQSRHTDIPCEQLFNAAAEPVVLIETTLGRIVDANPAAASLLGISRAALIGTLFLNSVHAFSCKGLRASVADALRTGNAKPIVVRARRVRTQVSVRLSTVVVPPSSYLIARLAGANDAASAIPSLVMEAIESGAMGLLIADADLRVEYANRSFIEMLECASLEDLCGRVLTHWVEFSPEDIAQLRTQMAQRRALSILVATLRGPQLLTRDIELHAVAVPDEHNPRWAFIVRPRSRLN